MFQSLPLLALLLSPCDTRGWELKPDPPAGKGWTLKNDLAVPLAGRSDRIAFAEGNGPFVLVAPVGSAFREVYDLRTGMRTGRFDGGEKSTFATSESLSPDGTTWASAKPFGNEVRVINAGSGHQRALIKLAAAIRAIAFVGNDRLLVIGTEGLERIAQLFNANGQETGKWRLDPSRINFSGATPNCAASPGGKYLATVGVKTVAVHSLPDGKKMADLDLPAEPPATGRVLPPVGIAFSANGAELAVVVGKDDKSVGKLIVWNLADGRKTESEIERPEVTAGLDSASLTPILSGGWLIDGTQVWSDGKPRRSVPRGPLLPSARLAITPEQVIGVAEVKATRNTAVSVITESVGTAGPARDGSLEGAREATVNARDGWPGPVGGFTPTFEPNTQQIDLNHKRAVGLSIPLDGRRWMVEADFGPAPETARRTVHVHDARTGAAFSTFVLPAKRLLFGEAVTSEAVLTIGAPDEYGSAERLEMWAADGRPIGAWRPHASAKPDRFRSSIAYAAALASNRAVTVGNGRVTVWQLPEAKAVWTAVMPEAAGGTLSPDGKMLFVPHVNGVRAFDVETGETRGNLKGNPLSPRPGQNMFKAAVSSDGRRLAVSVAAPLGREVRVWDLTTGAQTTSLQMLTFDPNPAFRFLGPRFLLVGEIAYDVTDGREIWRVRPGHTGVISDTSPADDRFWYAVPDGSRWAVAPARFPANELTEFLTTFKEQGKSLLRPGEKTVALVIEAPADAPVGWEPKARENARSGLQSAKLTESKDSPTIVRIRYTKSAAGPPVKFKWEGIQNFGREETVTRFVVECQAEVTRDGESLWKGTPSRHEMRIKDWPLVNEITDDSKSGSEFFSRQVWNSAAEAARYPTLMLGQSVVIKDGQTWKLPLESVLAANGITVNFPSGFIPLTPAKAVDGNPRAEVAKSDPQTQPAVRWQTVVIASVGGVGFVLAAGAVAVIVILARRTRSQERNSQRRQSGQSNERRRKER